MRCVSRMLISNVHKSIININSIDTRFSRNVFEAIQKSRSMCFIGSKTNRLCLVVLNPIKHSCSFFKQYINILWNFCGNMLHNFPIPSLQAKMIKSMPIGSPHNNKGSLPQAHTLPKKMFLFGHPLPPTFCKFLSYRYTLNF